MKRKTAFFCLLAILLSFLLNSCFGGVESVRYDNIKLSEKAITLRVGDSFALSADIVSPYGDVELFWHSSDYSITNVIDGVMTGVAPGICTVKAYTANGGADICTVTVTPAETLQEQPPSEQPGEGDEKEEGDENDNNEDGGENDNNEDGGENDNNEEPELDLEALVNFEVFGCPASYEYTDKNMGTLYTKTDVLSYEVYRSYYPETTDSPAYIYITVVFKCVKTYDVDGEQGRRKSGIYANLYREGDSLCESKRIVKQSAEVGEEFDLYFSFKAGTDGVTVRDFYLVLGDVSV